MTDQARADIAVDVAKVAVRACLIAKVMTSEEAGAMLAQCLQTLRRSPAALEIDTETDHLRLKPAANVQSMAAQTGTAKA